MVFLPDVDDVGHTVRNRLLLVRLQAGIQRPIRIQRHAHDIPLGAIFGQGIQVAVVQGLVEAVVQMDDDLGLREDFLHGIIAGSEEPGILLRVVPQVADRFQDGNAAQGIGDGVAPLVPLDGPEEAVGGLVAHLYPTGLDAFGLQGGKDVFGMIGQQDLDLFVALATPGGGDILLLGIGPEVAVVEIDHDGHIQFPGSPGFHQQVLLAVPVTVPGRIHPYAEADGVQPQFLHQGRTLPFLPFPIVEFEPVGFVLGGPANIGPFPIMPGFAGRKERYKR